jgi:heterotetrameric sarcosine oxidase delta subunit
MLQIRCPWCGEREYTEFSYGADADVRHPADPQAMSDAEWTRLFYFRDNPKGPHAELWQHIGGCRAWFKVLRDTVSHRILATGLPHEPLEEKVEP